MAKPDQSPRPLALIATRPVADAGLAAALREDLQELLQFLHMRVETGVDPAVLARSAAGHRGPVLVAFSDVAALPADCVDGALELLEDLDVVVGPCPDGSVYLLGLAEGLEQPVSAGLIGAALEPGGLASCVELLERSGLESAALPPWFRLGNDKELSFAESLMRLSLLSEEGENDFIADRLRIWFEKRDKS
ncbi:MAG: DUF2064 domain-containing protein [Planctomycetes bacterium]|nr:DUF2064 domain-containing protein [Planctomycetota bacterium]MCB9935229.1 DUF2064 domain-containing protein [Planctomycetota bacterium]